jgi:UDP:flavonoid glycosyltransferase YjiC (YdhE family)
MRALIPLTGVIGHFHPVVPIARALAERGHTVAFATRRSFHAAVRQAGFATLALDFDGSGDCATPFGEVSPGGVEPGQILAGLVARAVAPAREIMELARAWQSDVLVSQGWRCCSSACITSWAAWLAGDALGILRAQVDFGSWPSEMLRTFAAEMFAKAREDLGLSPDPELRTLEGPLRILCGPPNWFPDRWLKPNTKLLQPPDYDGESTETRSNFPLNSNPDNGRLVYANVATNLTCDFQLLELICEALGDEELSVVVTVGDGLRSSRLSSVPANIKFFQYVPQSVVVPRCQAVLTFGGYGTTMWALRTGVPIVALPHATAYYEATAGSIVRLGVGIAITSAHRSPKNLRDAVHAVLDDTNLFKREARSVANSIHSLPPIAHAAELIERLVEGSQSQIRTFDDGERSVGDGHERARSDGYGIQQGWT